MQRRGWVAGLWGLGDGAAAASAYSLLHCAAPHCGMSSVASQHIFVVWDALLLPPGMAAPRSGKAPLPPFACPPCCAPPSPPVRIYSPTSSSLLDLVLLTSSAPRSLSLQHRPPRPLRLLRVTIPPCAKPPSSRIFCSSFPTRDGAFHPSANVLGPSEARNTPVSK